MTNYQLQIKHFVFGPFETNCYVISTDDQILLVDPACSNEFERLQLENYINRQSIVPRQSSNRQLSIIATHGHLDHLWGAAWATSRWNTPVLIHEADIPLAQAMQSQYNLFGIRRQAEDFPIENIKSKILNLKSEMSNFQLLETPGHTPGSICLYFPQSSINRTSSIVQSSIFVGDTLFRMGYGRTDLPGGNIGQLIDSLERLFTLPADTVVYPGHGDFTTIGAERR